MIYKISSKNDDVQYIKNDKNAILELMDKKAKQEPGDMNPILEILNNEEYTLDLTRTKLAKAQKLKDDKKSDTLI